MACFGPRGPSGFLSLSLFERECLSIPGSGGYFGPKCIREKAPSPWPPRHACRIAWRASEQIPPGRFLPGLLRLVILPLNESFRTGNEYAASVLPFTVYRFERFRFGSLSTQESRSKASPCKPDALDDSPGLEHLWRADSAHTFK